MRQFKEGDRVRRISGSHYGISPAIKKTMVKGDEDVVVSCHKSCLTLELKSFGGGHDPAMFELVTPEQTEQEQRKAAATRVRAAVDEFNAATAAARELGLTSWINRYGGTGEDPFRISVNSINYTKTINEAY